MSHLFDRDDDTGTVFRDVIFLMMITFVILFLVAVMHINPIAEPKEEEATPPGNVVVNIFWEGDKNIDVDLWVKGPKDKIPVGYSNRAGETFNLLRDDLGTNRDDTGMNFENAYSRGAPDGEYVVNVHMFAHKESPAKYPVEVRVEIYFVNPDRSKGAKVDIYTGTVSLTHHGHETTVVRFRMEDKSVVEGSINRIEKKLRSRAGPRPNEWTF